MPSMPITSSIENMSHSPRLGLRILGRILGRMLLSALLPLLLLSPVAGAEAKLPKTSAEPNKIPAAGAEAAPEVTRIAFGSCNKHDAPQPLWAPIQAFAPQAFIWTGDIVYGDTRDMSVLRAKYTAQKAQPDYAALRARTRILGVWDDHDYGENNAGKEYPMRDSSQAALLDFLDEPSDSPRRRQQGVYASHLLGPEGRQIKVILLDCRYHRDPPGAKGDVLGEVQWKWLEGELKQSPARIHLIVSGIQILPEEHKYEKWANFPAARKRLLDLIAASGAPGVLLLSGDRHIAEISRMDVAGLTYPLYEVTSSGMTHSWEGIGKEANQHRVGDLFPKLNFGALEVDWKGERPEVKLQIRDRDGKVRLEQAIKFP